MKNLGSLALFALLFFPIGFVEFSTISEKLLFI